MRTPDSVFPSRYSRDRFPEFQATRCSPQVRFLRFARFEPTIADKTLRLPLLRFVILGRFLAKLSQKLRTSESRYFVFDRPFFRGALTGNGYRSINKSTNKDFQITFA